MADVFQLIFFVPSLRPSSSYSRTKCTYRGLYRQFVITRHYGMAARLGKRPPQMADIMEPEIGTIQPPNPVLTTPRSDSHRLPRTELSESTRYTWNDHRFVTKKIFSTQEVTASSHFKKFYQTNRLPIRTVPFVFLTVLTMKKKRFRTAPKFTLKLLLSITPNVYKKKYAIR